MDTINRNGNIDEHELRRAKIREQRLDDIFLVESWKTAGLNYREDSATFLKYIITYSSLSLGFSITFISNFLKDRASDVGSYSMFWLGFSWLALSLTIIVGIFSVQISRQANVREVEIEENKYNRKDDDGRNSCAVACVTLEWILFALVVVGTLSNVLFILYHIGG